MLGFSGGIAFRVDVRNFLQLEGSIHRDWVVDGAAEEHEVVHAIVKLSKLFYLIECRQNRFRLLGQRKEFTDVMLGQRL